MRILIADDHPIFRGGLRRVLEDCGHQVVAECDDGKCVMACVKTHRPDVVLIDLQMPIQDGIATVRALKGDPPSVILTVSEDQDDMKAAMDAGAGGYLLKSAEPGDLMQMLDAVVKGYRIYPDRPTELSDEARLSRRQMQVLEGLVSGQTLKKIAQNLGISQFTVRTYQERLLEKFDVHSRAELIFAASRKSETAEVSGPKRKRPAKTEMPV